MAGRAVERAEVTAVAAVESLQGAAARRRVAADRR